MRPSPMRSTLTWSPSRAREAMTVTHPGPSSTRANGTLMARGHLQGFHGPSARHQREPLTWYFTLERVTGIEPALSAWEADVLPLNYTRAVLTGSTRLARVRPDIVPDKRDR